MQRRTTQAALLGLVAVAACPASAAADPVSFRHGTIDRRLTTTQPNSPTGLDFAARYHAAGDPDAPPPYMRKMTFYGRTKLDTSVPERCTASDVELAASGAAACPRGSRVGGGASEALFMGRFPTRVQVDVFNNTNEQIMVARSPLLASVARGRIHPDGSIEFASPTCFPSVRAVGCPVDYVLQLRSEITVPPYTRSSGGAIRSYMTTPHTCPKTRAWRSVIRLWWADESVDTVVTSQPCRRTKPKGRTPKRAPRRA